MLSLVITGNPGVGKHTIAKNLAKILDYKILDINKIVCESNLYEKTEKTHDVDVIKLNNVLKRKILKKSIIVGHLAPYVLTKSQISKAIILRKSPYSLSQIYKKRKYSKKKTAENLESEILGIVAFETLRKFSKKKTFQIDTTKKSVAKISKQITDILNEKKKKKKESAKAKEEDTIIDWLSVVAKKNDLQKFFSY